MIQQRLRRRMTATGIHTLEEYLSTILEDGNSEELSEAVDLLTTNTTSFFREPQHFDFLTKTIIPGLVASGKKRFKVWSAAASEGAEAYTIAMVLSEIKRAGTDIDWAILGTDVSTRMVEKATTAIYNAEQLEGMPKHLLQRYFLTARHPSMGGQGRVVPELRAKVRFRLMNLMDTTYPLDRDISVAFLRNVLIYFESADQKRVVEQVARHIAPGGYLLVGHSESMAVASDQLKLVAPTIFRKV